MLVKPHTNNSKQHTHTHTFIHVLIEHVKLLKHVQNRKKYKTDRESIALER